MNVTKDMVNVELQPLFGFLKILSYLLSRVWGIKFLNFVYSFSRGKEIVGLKCEEQSIPSQHGGPDIRVRIFRPLGEQERLPVMHYYHGGGLVIGNPEIALEIIKRFIDIRPCVVIAPDYRKALEAPFPGGFNDCYDTLLWAKENAEALGIEKDKIILAGHSAGGGLVASLTLKVRDTKELDIAFQMPMYPMIDDRQDLASAKNMNVPFWNTKTNSLAWSLYLKNLKNEKLEIPIYAAAARNNNCKDLPPAITFVSQYEPFKDETFRYVESLKKEGVPVAFKYFDDAVHGFDAFGGGTKIGQEALEFTYSTFAEYYDNYVV